MSRECSTNWKERNADTIFSAKARSKEVTRYTVRHMWQYNTKMDLR
jgi:hypothetical protein